MSVAIYIFNVAGIIPLIIILIVLFCIIYAMLSFLSSMLEMYQYFVREKGKKVAGICISIFAIGALIENNIRREYNSTTGDYSYYPPVIFALSGGHYGGGFSGFGGGSFGGGGAGGSW